MAADELFYTIEAPVDGEIVVKKSRFIGRIIPTESVEEAEATLARIREVHKAANHNCFAYRIGRGVPIERFSDDGEPSGTAGRPILEVLRRRPMLNALVVVTRYFGGVLLGANGLIRAYAGGAANVIDKATVLKCTPMHRVTVTCDYGQYGKLEYELQERGFILEDKEYTEQVAFSLWVEPSSVDSLTEDIANWTGGQARSVALDAEYVGVRPDGSMVHPVLYQE